jgi:hypothetical protein
MVIQSTVGSPQTWIMGEAITPREQDSRLHSNVQNKLDLDSTASLAEISIGKKQARAVMYLAAAGKYHGLTHGPL